jgi:hypothetical protein
MSRHFAYKAGPGRVRAAATAALLLVAGLFAASVATPSDAAPPSTTIPPSLLVSVSTDNSALTGPLGAPTDAVPTVLTAKNTATIDVTITVNDGTELTKGTVINLTPVRADTAKPVGSFDPGTFTVPTKGSTFTFPVAYTAAEDGIALRAALKKTTSTSPQPGQSAFFDVLETLKLTPKGDSSFETGLGADTCTSTSNVSVCGVVYLPHGIGSAFAALSSGVCSAEGCTGGKEVQFIAGLESSAGVNIYSPDDPATLVLQCDKSRCKGKGVSSYKAFASLSATGPLAEVPACVSKGVIQAGVPFCTDYVSSHRDNAGDVLLHVLFFTDMRGTI